MDCVNELELFVHCRHTMPCHATEPTNITIILHLSFMYIDGTYFSHFESSLLYRCPHQPPSVALNMARKNEWTIRKIRNGHWSSRSQFAFCGLFYFRFYFVSHFCVSSLAFVFQPHSVIFGSTTHTVVVCDGVSCSRRKEKVKYILLRNKNNNISM